MSVLNCPWCGRLIGLVARDVLARHLTGRAGDDFREICPASGKHLTFILPKLPIAFRKDLA